MVRRLGIPKSDFSLMTSAVEHGIYHANSCGHAVIRYNHRHWKNGCGIQLKAE